jgi:predicted neutral ceramidase superfamily lipid hydrolase
MKPELITLSSLIILGIVVGVISNFLGSNLLSLGLAILTIILVGSVFSKVYKQKFNWVMSNGGWIYIFIWFITWIILYNL